MNAQGLSGTWNYKVQAQFSSKKLLERIPEIATISDSDTLTEINAPSHDG